MTTAIPLPTFLLALLGVAVLSIWVAVNVERTRGREREFDVFTMWQIYKATLEEVMDAYPETEGYATNVMTRAGDLWDLTMTDRMMFDVWGSDLAEQVLKGMEEERAS